MEQSNPSHPANSLSGGGPSIPIGATIPRWQIWVGWLLATAVGMGLGFPSETEIAGGGGSGFLDILFPIRSQSVLGLTLGMAQSLVLLRIANLRRRPLIDLQWIAATVVGMLLGGFATGVVRIIMMGWFWDVLVDRWWVNVLWAFAWPIPCGLFVGACQQIVLRVRDPLRWAVPSAVGWLAGFAVGAIPTFLMPASNGSRVFEVTGRAGTGIIVGIVTGAALVWLLAHPAHPDDGSPPDESPATMPRT